MVPRGKGLLKTMWVHVTLVVGTREAGRSPSPLETQRSEGGAQ